MIFFLQFDKNITDWLIDWLIKNNYEDVYIYPFKVWGKYTLHHLMLLY